MTNEMTTDNSERIYIGVAWPYANGEQHIGHIAGAYLPPDIFARYNRLRGREVLMVSGSDTHGTPITVRADEDGVAPSAIIDRFHPRFIEAYQKLGITFDLFTHTDTEMHWKTTQELFLRHLEAGYLYRDKQKQLFDPEAGHFLPDRYVEGNCPSCGADGARGDQCDTCGATYDAVDLKNPRSKRTGNANLEVRETEHFFLDLGKLNDSLHEWIQEPHEHWRASVLNFTRSQIAEKKLRGRPITRDMSWGIPIPIEGFDDKRIYVWYDAVIGYLSATREWATLSGQPDAARSWWYTGAARSYYFIGKDNIPFHTIIWPAMLIALGDQNLPYDVPANEYLNIRGMKFSKSKGVTIGINDVLERYQPDAWRYALTSMAPETQDVDFTWEDFVERVNNELVANWGNLVNRMVTFAWKRFDGRVPEIEGELDERSAALLGEIENGFQSVGAFYESVRLKQAAEECRRLSALVNQYITDTAPFKMIKEDVPGAARAVFVALQAIDWLSVLWSPILPHSSQQVREILGHDGPLFGRQFTETVTDARGTHLVLRYDGSGAKGEWHARRLSPGQAMREPAALFTKLDEKLPEEEAARAASLAGE